MGEAIRLTQYSHGAGCGCKISPAVLDVILGKSKSGTKYKNLIVGNESKDDAAVYDMGDGRCIISTTDFFMPIVDDASQFGKIASANALSDVYAMGGTPFLAIAILGWPLNKIPPETAGQVLDGARVTCDSVNVALAGGHSIDSPEPIFGLAVTGEVDLKNLKQNNRAKAGDLLYLTKPIGVGILTTAEKKGILKKEQKGIAAESMMKLNYIGELFGKMEGVHAMTDVTGFGLLGHLREMCDGSGVSAVLSFNKVKLIADMDDYLQQGSFPGGTSRNWDSYGSFVKLSDEKQKYILCDPQTNGGLLISVAPQSRNEVEELMKKEGLSNYTEPIGEMMENTKGTMIAVE